MEDEIYIKKYLLGELSGEDLEAAEKRLLADESFYRQVLVAEKELALDFSTGYLTDPEADRFRNIALDSPAGDKEIRFERALQRYVAENAPPALAVPPSPQPSWLSAIAAFFRRPSFGLAVAAMLLLTVGLSIWTVVQNRRLQGQIARLETQQAADKSRSAELSQQLNAEKKNSEDRQKELEQSKIDEQELQIAFGDLQARQSKPDSIAVFMAPVLLFAGLTRGGGGTINPVEVPTGVRTVPLLLDMAHGNYTQLEGELIMADGSRHLKTLKLGRARKNGEGYAVLVTIPIRYLPPGDYGINLRGKNAAGEVEDIESFSFRVKNKAPSAR